MSNRSVLKEIQANDVLNVTGPSDGDSNTSIVKPMPSTNKPNVVEKSMSAAKIENVENLAVREDHLSVNIQNDTNIASSDDELFQECEETSFVTTAEGTKFDETIDFPSPSVANSTVNGVSTKGSQWRQQAISYNAFIDSSLNLTDSTRFNQMSSLQSMNSLDRTIQLSQQNDGDSDKSNRTTSVLDQTTNGDVSKTNVTVKEEQPNALVVSKVAELSYSNSDRTADVDRTYIGIAVAEANEVPEEMSVEVVEEQATDIPEEKSIEVLKEKSIEFSKEKSIEVSEEKSIEISKENSIEILEEKSKEAKVNVEQEQTHENIVLNETVLHEQSKVSAGNSTFSNDENKTEIVEKTFISDSVPVGDVKSVVDLNATKNIEINSLENGLNSVENEENSCENVPSNAQPLNETQNVCEKDKTYDAMDCEDISMANLDDIVNDDDDVDVSMREMPEVKSDQPNVLFNETISIPCVDQTTIVEPKIQKVSFNETIHLNVDEPEQLKSTLNETIVVDGKLPTANTTFMAQSVESQATTDRLKEANDAVKPNDDFAFNDIPASTDNFLGAQGTAHEINEEPTKPVENQSDVNFKIPLSVSGFAELKKAQKQQSIEPEEEFQAGGMILNPDDFDFLLSKGSASNKNINRDSILERFDPLSRKSIYQPSSKQPPIVEVQTNSSSIEEETTVAPLAQVNESLAPIVRQTNITSSNFIELDSPKTAVKSTDELNSNSSSLSETYVTAPIEDSKSKSSDVAMSSEIIQDIRSDSLKSIEQANYKMNDEMKTKLDSVEAIEQKLKEAEAREEALIRRITEKDKDMKKINAVIENYERRMVELLAEREQHAQKYDMELSQLKSESDANLHHLTSLENTFSDLHAKYEKSKQVTAESKENELKLLEKLDFAQQQIKLQEQRYEKLKNHALTQLETANSKLESYTKSHSNEIKKLQAQLKKEEISRQSIMEQLAQKSKENEALVKICDELINNGPDGS